MEKETGPRTREVSPPARRGRFPWVTNDPKINWFDWYCQQIDAGQFKPEREGIKYCCPCCGCPTLDSRGGFEVCRICFWEDDGQDGHNADAVLGGPNSDYSLTESRKNFDRHYTCYRPSDTHAFETSAGRREWAEQVLPLFAPFRWQGGVRLPDELKKIIAAGPPSQAEP